MRRPVAYHAVQTYGFAIITQHDDVTVLRNARVGIVLVEKKHEPALAVAFRLDLAENRTAGNIERTVQTSDDVYRLAEDAAALPDRARA